MKASPLVRFCALALGWLVCLSAGRAADAPVKVEVTVFRIDAAEAPEWVKAAEEAGLIGVFDPEKSAAMRRDLERVDSLVETRFGAMVRSGQRAKLDAVRGFPVPTEFEKGGRVPLRFERQDVGLALEVTPKLIDDKLDLKFAMSSVRLIGFPVTGRIWQPSFSNLSLETSVSLSAGQSVMLRLGSENDTGDRVTTLAMVSAEILATDAGDGGTAASQVEIEGRMIEVSEEASEALEALRAVVNRTLKAEEFEALIRTLNRGKGIEMLSTPKVTTKVDQRATINLVREFRYPTAFDPAEGGTSPTPNQFATENTGVTLEVEPKMAEGGAEIDLMLDARVVDFDGFINYAAEMPPTWSGDGAVKNADAAAAVVINQPIFGVRRAATRVSVASGDTIVLGGVARRDEQTIESGPPGNRIKEAVEITKTLFVFVTPRWVDSEGKVVSDRAARVLAGDPTPSLIFEQREGMAPRAEDGMPYGSPVTGKPGFVTSPHAPESGYVDLRGFPPDTEVKCPYSGRLFLVP